MSSELAIQARGVSKKYQLGQLVIGYATVREELGRAMRRVARRSEPREDGLRTLWALSDVDMDVRSGEAVGIIGANGAGKTTLLKLLTRITTLTSGEIVLRGRVGSLLEVGAGFHPELTGRENIFLNGSLLGMRKAEIARRLDEIVAFADVERFVETPVKRYSSGMYVRLAFAVAAHLEPDILIVDEVLAVGDASFQRKCMGKMAEVADAGRTVILVSHNMAAIRSLTERTLHLEHGRVAAYGPTSEVVTDYLRAHGHDTAGGFVDLTADELRRDATKRLRSDARFRSIELQDLHGTKLQAVPELEPFQLDIAFTVDRPARFLELLVRVRTHDGTLIFSCFSGQLEREVLPGAYRMTCAVHENPLRTGRYAVELVAVTTEPQDMVRQALLLEIESGHLAEENPRYMVNDDGLIRVESSWGELVDSSD
jgi:lipopolysaccharide transport system ATP-binding protein